MLVKVAVDLALDRLFDYEVPEALEKKLAVCRNGCCGKCLDVLNLRCL